ncbi:MAG: 3-deoxy-8-phosphooctulonate synthase [Planctomycetes bacterium]|nr:3-deoxy-8-phosphooctulonate synthase [Planctomycetota bacterium]
MKQTLRIGEYQVGPSQPLLVIAGPCVIESLDQCLQIGAAVLERCAERGLSYVFKASFDKANRSSIHSARGPGLEEGLRILEQCREKLGVPVTTDIHESSQAAAAGQAVDVIQIPAFLCRQTDLLAAAGATGKPVNVKKGQFLSPAEMTNVISKLTESKAAGIMLTERGTFFGYNRLVNDFIGLGDMLDLGYPVCFDVTHSTQQPGGQGHTSGGRPDRAPLLARAAVAAGVHSLFLETHPNPPKALSDAATVLPIPVALNLLDEAAKLRGAMA